MRILIKKSIKSSMNCFFIVIGGLSLLVSQVYSQPTETTLDEIRNKIQLSRSSVQKLFVEFSVERKVDDSLAQSGILKHLSRNERHKFAFDGVRRYSDFSVDGFIKNSGADNYVAVFDGEKSYTRTRKSFQVSSKKSASVDMCSYLNLLLWPITNPDFYQYENEPPDVNPFLPKMLESKWALPSESFVINEMECIKLADPLGKREIYLSVHHNYAPVRYWFDATATPKGLGEVKCDFFDFVELNGISFPLRITSEVQFNKLNSVELAGILSGTLIVKDIRINENVPNTLFELVPEMGDLVIDSDSGMVRQVMSKDPYAIENALIEAKGIFTTNKRLDWLQLSSISAWCWGALLLGFAASIFLRYFPVSSRISKLILFTVAGLSINSSVKAQDLEQAKSKLPKAFEYITRNDYQVIFRTTINGNLGVYYEPRGFRFITPLPVIELLRNEEISKELEIVQPQLEELNAVANKLEIAINEANKFSEDFELLPWKLDVQKRICELFDEPVRQGNQVVKEILLRHQTHVLEKILLMYQARRFGLYVLLTKTDLADRLHISEAQKEDLERTYREEIKAGLGQLAEIKQDAVDELVSVLTERQREQLRLQVGDFKSLAIAPLPALLVQFDPKLLEQVESFELDSPWDRYQLLIYNSEFRIGMDARPIIDKLILEKDQVESGIARILLEIICEPEMQKILLFENAQHIDANNLRMRKTSFVNEVLEAQNRFREQFGNQNPQALAELTREKWKVWSKECINHAERMLSPFQQERLDQIVTLIGVRRSGLLCALTSSSLGRALRINDQQREELRKQAQEIRDRVISQAVEIEQALNRKLIDKLNPKQRQQFSDLTDLNIILESGFLDFHSTMLDPAVQGSILHEIQLMSRFVAPDNVSTSQIPK